MSTTITISIDLDLLMRLKELAQKQSTAEQHITYGDLIRGVLVDRFGEDETVDKRQKRK